MQHSVADFAHLVELEDDQLLLVYSIRASVRCGYGTG